MGSNVTALNITYLPRVEKVSGNALKNSAIPVYAFLT